MHKDLGMRSICFWCIYFEEILAADLFLDDVNDVVALGFLKKISAITQDL